MSQHRPGAPKGRYAAPGAAGGTGRAAHRRKRRGARVRMAASVAGAVPGVVGLVALTGAVAGAIGGPTSLQAAPGPQRPAVVDTTLARERSSAAARAASRGTTRAYVPLPGDPLDEAAAQAAAPATAPAAPAPAPPAPETPVVAEVPAADLLPNGFPRVPGCAATVAEDAANGRVGSQHLCSVGGGHELRPDAAAAYLALDEAFAAEFGEPLELTDSYRSLAAQYSLADEKPGLAARPGTSEHGWGLAVDVFGGVERYSSAQHRWLREHGPAFGWDNPAWARDGAGREEPWHWEYDETFVRTA